MGSDTGAPSTGINRHVVGLDESISWRCSGHGWNCCVDKTIPLRPYDVIRLRHAAGIPSDQLIERGIVTLEWDAAGLLGGWLAHRGYEGNRTACVFYEEITSAEARRLRESDPGGFRALPADVQAAAEEPADRRVAGLCGVHTGRPEACRGFPFQRNAGWEERPDRAAAQIFDCGSCALAETTTPREVMLDNGLDEYWRAGDAYRAVAHYLHKAGLANITNSSYRRLPLDPAERQALWAALYTPDSNPAVRALTEGGEQWRTPLDIEGDREVLRLVYESTLDAADTLIEESAIPPEQLGGPGDPLPRPDLDPLLDPSRPVLPPR